MYASKYRSYQLLGAYQILFELELRSQRTFLTLNRLLFYSIPSFRHTYLHLRSVQCVISTSNGNDLGFVKNILLTVTIPGNYLDDSKEFHSSNT